MIGIIMGLWLRYSAAVASVMPALLLTQNPGPLVKVSAASLFVAAAAFSAGVLVSVGLGDNGYTMTVDDDRAHVDHRPLRSIFLTKTQGGIERNDNQNGQRIVVIA